MKELLIFTIITIIAIAITVKVIIDFQLLKKLPNKPIIEKPKMNYTKKYENVKWYY